MPSLFPSVFPLSSFFLYAVLLPQYLSTMFCPRFSLELLHFQALHWPVSSPSLESSSFSACQVPFLLLLQNSSPKPSLRNSLHFVFGSSLILIVVSCLCPEAGHMSPSCTCLYIMDLMFMGTIRMTILLILFQDFCLLQNLWLMPDFQTLVYFFVRHLKTTSSGLLSICIRCQKLISS